MPLSQQALFAAGDISTPAALDRTVFSECGRYRWFLRRAWEPSKPVWLFIGANPSKAGRPDGKGSETTDPTVSGQANRARALGYGTLWVVNARSFISTDPNGVPPDPEGIGEETDMWIERAARAADLVVCAYGHLAGVRGPRVLEVVRSVGKVPHALALTQDGTPRHPRAIPSSARPFPLEGFT